MTIFELREVIESAIKVWYLFAAIGVLTVIYIVLELKND